MEHTLDLIARAHKGEKEARDTLFEENMGLVYSVARRFMGRGAELEDLIQIGGLGLLKAVDKFDMEFHVRFSTYAVPMISGEIRRYLRDDGMLKVSRSVKESRFRIYREKEELEGKLGREPTLLEVAKELGLSVEELVFAMDSCSEVESLQKVICQGEGSRGDISLMDRLPEKKNGQEEVLDRIFLEQMLGNLGEKERRLIYMRYFREMTQVEIAAELGISQVQVSRMEKRILERLRREWGAEV